MCGFERPAGLTPFPSIDQVMAWSPSFYKNTTGITARSMTTGRGQLSRSWVHNFPAYLNRSRLLRTLERTIARTRFRLPGSCTCASRTVAAFRLYRHLRAGPFCKEDRSYVGRGRCRTVRVGPNSRRDLVKGSPQRGRQQSDGFRVWGCLTTFDATAKKSGAVGDRTADLAGSFISFGNVY